jgi:hypothetical protein
MLVVVAVGLMGYLLGLAGEHLRHRKKVVAVTGVVMALEVLERLHLALLTQAVVAAQAGVEEWLQGQAAPVSSS